MGSHPISALGTQILLPVSVKPARAFTRLRPNGASFLALPSLQDSSGAVGTLLTRRRPSEKPRQLHIGHLASTCPPTTTPTSPTQFGRARGSLLPPGLARPLWFQLKSLVGLSVWMTTSLSAGVPAYRCSIVPYGTHVSESPRHPASDNDPVRGNPRWVRYYPRTAKRECSRVKTPYTSSGPTLRCP